VRRHSALRLLRAAAGLAVVVLAEARLNRRLHRPRMPTPQR